MNKVEVQIVKQFPEQNYIAGSSLNEVCNLFSISIEQTWHDLKVCLDPVQFIHFNDCF